MCRIVPLFFFIPSCFTYCYILCITIYHWHFPFFSRNFVPSEIRRYVEPYGTRNDQSESIVGFQAEIPPHQFSKSKFDSLLRPHHRLSSMAEPARITRSAKRVAAEAATPSRAEPVDSPTPAGKRVKFETTPSGPADSASRVRQVIADVELEQIKAELAQEEEDLAHPPLTFDYAHARTHLIGLDERWRHWMDRLKCKPFEEPEIYNPFRSLVVSIIGQQISFLAARSVTHRFTRIWFPHLPEKLGAPTIGAPAPVDASPFPTPHQVAAVDVDTLRAAGLSGRKVEYIQGLAGYFVRGEITARGLLGKDDDEVRKTLLAVRGIGPWTIDMFLIFTARRPVGLTTRSSFFPR